MARVLGASRPGGEVRQHLDTLTLQDRIRAAIDEMLHEHVEPNECADVVESRTQEWAARFGIVEARLEVERFAKIRCGSFAAHTYSDAPIEIIEIGAALIGWLFLFDDQYGEGSDLAVMRTMFANCRKILTIGELPASPQPFHNALLDLRRRLQILASDEWLLRFADDMNRYFNGCLFEFPYRQTGSPPPLSAYRRLRPWSIGALPVFDLVELVVGEPPQSDLLEDMREIGATLCAWTNDVHSYTKEIRSRDPLNLVAVLLNERAGGLEDALDGALVVYHDDLQRLETLRERVEKTRGSTPEDVATARAICQWVHGNAAWTKLSGRYHSSASTPESTRSEERIKLTVL